MKLSLPDIFHYVIIAVVATDNAPIMNLIIDDPLMSPKVLKTHSSKIDQTIYAI